MKYDETIREAKRIYASAISVSETEKGIELLRTLPAPPVLDRENEAFARSYAYRLTLKKLSFEFFGTLGRTELSALTRYAQKCLPALETKYPSTHADFVRAEAAAEGLAGASEIADRGRSLLEAAMSDAKIADELDKTAAEAEDEAARIGVSDIPAFPFGERVSFFDVKERAASLLTGMAKELRAESARLRRADADALVRELAEPFDGELADYFPDLVREEQGMPGAIVLCTPFMSEAELYVRSVSAREGRKFVRVNAVSLGAYPSGTADGLMSAVAESGRDIFLTGAAHMPGDGDELLVSAMRFGRSGRRIYIADDSDSVYAAAVKSAAPAGLSASDVGRLDIGLPFFRDVMGALIERGMASDGDEEEIRKLMPFAGYVGLNEAAAAFAAGREWKKAAGARSEDNAAEALEYLSRLSNPGRLIDPGWGDFSAYRRGTDEAKPAFDYDDIRYADPANIRRIMESDLTLFERIGALTRYCLLAGADSSAWPALDAEMRAERMKEATVLVYRALGISYTPEVSVEEDLGKGVGGLCCNGGRIIKYLARDAETYWITQRHIIHECFHAFQHEAISTGWRRWHWTELGVIRPRLDEWGYNFSHYYEDTSSKGYKVEIVECDARSFAEECMTRGDDCWNTIELQ